MEEICTNLSSALCEAGTGGYKIFYEEELLDCLPENMRNRETLEAALKNLSGGGYIDVKYARGNTFCLACLKKYEVQKVEPAPPTPCETDKKPNIAVGIKTYVTLCLCAFFGSAAGGALAAVIAAVI